MAFSPEKWLDAKGYFEAGLSLSNIEEKTGISRASISKRSKTEQWKKNKNADYIKAKELIAERNSTEAEESKHLLKKADEVAEDNIRRMKLVYGAQELAVKLIGKKLVEEGVDLAMADIKNGVDAVDKAGASMGIITKEPQIAIQNNNTNEQNTQIQIYIPNNERD